MISKIGRFSAYVPDIDLFHILLEILFLSDLKQGQEFDSPTYKIHQFFFQMKKSFPKMFEDVFFNYDPVFPYSEEVAYSFIRLQEAEFITRPNPSMNRYRIDVDLKDYESPLPQSDHEIVKSIAERFSEEFPEVNEPAS